MAGSYGVENPQNERYRLSFTVGGLLALQGKILATLFVENEREYMAPDVEPTNGATDTDHEIGERITRIRKQAVEENVLSILSLIHISEPTRP